ncbi:glycosyltransferase family 4 protein [Patescibacteria group bacterium]|nr:glycosyltransferase family 4 protein [Patescibacteria group bacterium]MBU0963445.1 glycosyltransferase family 4 protein [Patescibacteria group bacterium]
MKIIHLIGYFQPEFGYKEYYIARNQVKLGHEVFVITSDRIYPFPNLPELCKKINISADRKRQQGLSELDGIKIIRLPTLVEFKGLIIIKGVKKLLNKIKPDIVHAYEPVQFTPLLGAWYKKEKYFLISDHQQFEIPKTLLGKVFFYCLSRFLSNYMFKKADKVIFPTHDSIQFAKRWMKIDISKIKMIPLGYDPDYFYYDENERQVIRKQFEINENEILLITAGRVNRLKKIELVIKALKKIKDNRQARFLIFGSGDQEYISELKDLIIKTKLEDQIIFKDFIKREELFKYYNAADFGIWPEQPSITIIEAIGCRLPLILPDRKTVNHLIQFGNGIKFRRHDVNDLAEKIKQILLNRDIITQMRQNCERARENFNYLEISKRIVDLAR